MKAKLQRTLRGRLTILYGVLLAAALAIYAAGSALYFLHDLTRQLDASLDRDAETVEGILSFSAEGTIVLASHEGEAKGKESDHG